MPTIEVHVENSKLEEVLQGLDASGAITYRLHEDGTIPEDEFQKQLDEYHAYIWSLNSPTTPKIQAGRNRGYISLVREILKAKQKNLSISTSPDKIQYKEFIKGISDDQIATNLPAIIETLQIIFTDCHTVVPKLIRPHDLSKSKWPYQVIHPKQAYILIEKFGLKDGRQKKLNQVQTNLNLTPNSLQFINTSIFHLTWEVNFSRLMAALQPPTDPQNNPQLSFIHRQQID